MNKINLWRETRSSIYAENKQYFKLISLLTHKSSVICFVLGSFHLGAPLLLEAACSGHREPGDCSWVCAEGSQDSTRALSQPCTPRESSGIGAGHWGWSPWGRGRGPCQGRGALGAPQGPFQASPAWESDSKTASAVSVNRADTNIT